MFEVVLVRIRHCCDLPSCPILIARLGSAKRLTCIRVKVKSIIIIRNAHHIDKIIAHFLILVSGPLFLPVSLELPPEPMSIQCIRSLFILFWDLDGLYTWWNHSVFCRYHMNLVLYIVNFLATVSTTKLLPHIKSVILTGHGS